MGPRESQGSLNGEDGSRRVSIREMASGERRNEPLLAQNTEEGPKTQAAGGLQKLEKARERSPMEPAEEQLCQCLDLSPGRPCVDF